MEGKIEEKKGKKKGKKLSEVVEACRVASTVACNRPIDKESYSMMK